MLSQIWQQLTYRVASLSPGHGVGGFQRLGWSYLSVFSHLIHPSILHWSNPVFILITIKFSFTHYLFCTMHQNDPWRPFLDYLSFLSSSGTSFLQIQWWSPIPPLAGNALFSVHWKHVTCPVSMLLWGS